MDNKRYVIKFEGLFERGYVKISWWEKTRFVPLNTPHEGLQFATKFRFKWVADYYSWLLNKISDREFNLRTFTVKMAVMSGNGILFSTQLNHPY